MKIWTKEQRIALGLSEKESKLLEVLKNVESLNTSELSYQSSIPRITTMRILKILKERGFVVRKEHGKEVLWSITNPKMLEKRFMNLFKDSGFFSTRDINLSEVGSLAIYRGKNEMFESNRKMLIAHAGERVYAIEPNGIWKHFAKVQSKEVHEINMLWGQKKILVEMIVEEGFTEVIRKYVDTSIEESFLALAVDIRIVPKGFLDSSTEILIFRDIVLFMDWAHLVAVEIKNPSTVRVLKAMYRMLQESGRPYTHRSG